MSNRRRQLPVSRLIIPLCVTAIALAACGGDDPQKTLESLQSWQSTVDLAANATHLGWVPRRYGQQIRDRATAALNQTRQSPPEKASDAERERIRGAEDTLQAAIDSLSAVVGS